MPIANGQLRVVHCRPLILYARRTSCNLMPAALGVGFTTWLLAVWGFAGAFNQAIAVMLLMPSLLAFIVAPILRVNGTWLTIDRGNGWITWRRKLWPRVDEENFSPNRITLLHVKRLGLPSPLPGIWCVALDLDHPRLKRLRICAETDLKKCYEQARRIGAALQVDWVDEQGLLHISKPPTDVLLPEESLAFAPPEVELTSDGTKTEIMLPNEPCFSGSGQALMLFYALVWCLWSWSCMIVQKMSAGPVSQMYDSQRVIITLLAVGSAAGAMMLLHSAVLWMGRPVLIFRDGAWKVAWSWMGRHWLKKEFSQSSLRRIRRIDPPSGYAGLWVPFRNDHIRIGAGLNAYSLDWLARVMREPEKLHVPREEWSLSADTLRAA